jgi:SEA/GATOR complex protein SEA3/WDR59
VQWSPFPQRDYWIVSTSNQKALVWNLNHSSSHAPIEHTLHAHSRAITDINFSAHDPDLLATCAVDSFVHCWDLRHPQRPSMTFADWNAGATQVKWNRQDPNIIASSHDKFLKIWDKRKGAIPLKAIEAHSTKIYGVDWNRTRVSGIVTCSLDRTIKLWDYSQAIDEPERIIRTDYPVWRARYTPFGWGLLAMPQRGDFNLHLFDRRLSPGVQRDGHIDPVHSFRGHEDHVQEFLWRYRGSIEEGIDNRDFQLISWGADKHLRLHRMDPSWEGGVGHEKGKEVRKKLILSRLGADYHSFRDEKRYSPQDKLDLPGNRIFNPAVGGLTRAFSSVNSIPTGLLPSSLKTYAQKRIEKPENPMKWIEGVKIGSRSKGRESPTPGEPERVGETPESLGEEMTYVAKRYKKVEFEKADVHGRSAKVALYGPWGQENKPVLLRLNFEFPVAYPLQTTPEVNFERTHSGVSDDMIRKLQSEVLSIMEHYKTRRRGCLEALITYLLGEKNMRESMILKPHDGLEVPFGTPADEESSDEEEDAAVNPDDMENSATVLAPQTNVPIRRTCGALWGADGQLICFFPPKAEPTPVFSLDSLRTDDKTRSLPKLFEVFGRLKGGSLTSKEKQQDHDEDDHENNSSASESESSSSSSDESDNVTQLPDRFQPPLAWRAAFLRNQKPSSHSSSGHIRNSQTSKAKAVVSIKPYSDLLPAKKALAKEYLILGDGPSVCDHNADVATRFGLHTLAAVWELCKQILYDEVPLEKLDSKWRNEPILVLAKRNAARTKRKDSGLDVGFDEPEAVVKPRLAARVKWGLHPFASSWLIPALFEHYEKEADVQMLAMLSCIFCEPATQEGVHNALQTMEPVDLPVSVKAPAFSLDYNPSRAVALSFQERRFTSRYPTPSISTTQFVDYFSRQTGNSGSLGSSNGPSTDVAPSESVTPFSTGNTPPLPLSRQNTVTSSLSTSPDPATSRIVRRSNSTLSNAIASISRPFAINLSSSPPVPERIKVEADLSTSAPTSSITWGVNTSFTGSSPNSPVHRRKSNARSASFATYDSTYYSSDEDYESLTDDDDDAITISHSINVTSPKVNIALKNQRMFDDEGCASIPLLEPPISAKWATYRTVYANLLGRWCLHIAQAEVLKFNGLVPKISVLPPTSDGSSFHHHVAFELPRPSASFLRPLMAFNAQSATASNTQSPRNASSPSTSSRPLNPAAAPFVPQPGVGGLFRTSTNASSQSDVHGILSVPRSATPPLNAEKFDISATRRDSGNIQPTLLQRATSRARLGGDGKRSGDKTKGGSQDRTCVVCWEHVHGLHIVCHEGKHRAHMECVGDQQKSGNWKSELADNGIRCGCEVDRDSSWNGFVDEY